MQQLIDYLEKKFHNRSNLLFIIDEEGVLRRFLTLINFKQEISLFNINYKVKAYKSNRIEDFRLFIENQVRDREIRQNYLIIFSKINNITPYYEDLKNKAITLDFDLKDFVFETFNIEISEEIIQDPSIDLNYFIEHNLEILKYKMENVENLTDSFEIKKTSQLERLKDYIKDFDRNKYMELPEKPLFVVDMTFYEFKHILILINEINKKLTNKTSNLSNGEIYSKKRELLKNKIVNMYGKVPLDRNKGPRNISEHNKPKFAGNYMITISQMNLLEDNKKFNYFYNLLENNEERFLNEIRDFLLEKGKWWEYVNAINKVNQLENIKSRKEYRDKISHILYRKYHKFYPELKKYRWKKQFRYISRWLLDEELRILKDIPGKIKYEILVNIKDDFDIKEGDLFVHEFLEEEDYWIIKEIK